MKSISYLRLFHQRNLFLVNIKNKFIGLTDEHVRLPKKNVTHLCIEGFPRSANTFAYYLFLYANPSEEPFVAHHTHSIASIKTSIKHQIPLILLIREPLEAISSAYIYTPSDLDYYVRYYIKFYEWLIPFKKELVIAEFSSILTNFNDIVSKVNRTYKTEFMLIDDLEMGHKMVKQYLKSEEYNSKIAHITFNRGDSRDVLPSGQRMSDKIRVRTKLELHKEIEKAKNIYRKLTD